MLSTTSAGATGEGSVPPAMIDCRCDVVVSSDSGLFNIYSLPSLPSPRYITQRILGCAAIGMSYRGRCHLQGVISAGQV